MRFHIGFSKRISWKWIIGILGILGALLLGNHAVLALQVEADASGVYAKFPQNAQDGISAGQFLNYSSNSPYNITWSGNRYSAFSIESNPTRLGDAITMQPNGRIRWTYSSGTFNKCTSDQSATITFEFYLRKFTNSYMPKNWETPNLFSKVWVSTSSVGYDCQIVSRNGIKMTVSCTSKNPTSTYYIALENYNAPYPGLNLSDSEVNIGIRPLEVICTGSDSGAIITNNNTNTQNIINNQTENTQQIIESQNEINNSITDNSVTNDTTNFANTVFGTDPFQNHGLQAIITAPISMLQGILNSSSGTCQDLPMNINLTGSDTATYLPCGRILWDNVPSTIEAIFQTTIYGLLSYFILVDIVHTVNNTLDPERKNDYVMEL